MWLQIRRRRVRTAARRTAVRAGVRAQLAALKGAGGAGAAPAPGPAPGGGLAATRARAGIAPLRLFGSAHELEYFEDDEAGPELAAAGLAVAARPSPGVISAFRQVPVSS